MTMQIDLGRDDTIPTQYWHQLADGRIQCDVCPRACKLRENQRGVCFVRGRIDDQIVLTTYGRSSGFCIDPIEKKPLNHFLPGTAVLSFGTAGCNLGCRFCQNWDISKSREIDTLADAASPQQIATVAADLGCTSVAFTYNDPVIFLEYAIDTAIACRERGIKTVAVTAGYINSQPRRDLFGHLDAANIDLKAFDEEFYRHLAMGSLAPVLETIEYAHNETETWIELTNLLIPGYNDGNSELTRLSTWVAERLGPDVPLHFTAFHPDFKMLDTPPTPVATLRRAHRIARAHGLRYVYVGNVHDPEAESTRCPACATVVIERNWYTIGRYHLDDTGRCRECGEQIAGVFAGPAGSWGPRRRPVRIRGTDR
jgi:pyruvate formate lyase activating enzyme